MRQKHKFLVIPAVLLATPACATLPSFSIDNQIVGESAGVATVTIRKHGAVSASSSSVRVTTASGTAFRVTDYTSTTSVIAFAANEYSKTINIPIVNDSTYEATETFTARIKAVTNARIYDGSALVTITDDDEPPPPPTPPGNLPPLASADGPFVTPYNTAAVIAETALLANDTDPESNTLSVTSVQSPTHGTVARAGGNVTFTPTSGYSGSAAFTYSISDGNGGASTAAVGVTVSAPASPPSPPPSPPPPASSDTYPLASIASNFTVSNELVSAWGTGAIPASAAPDNVGAFRFICNPSHLAYDDPIVTRGK